MPVDLVSVIDNIPNADTVVYNQVIFITKIIIKNRAAIMAIQFTDVPVDGLVPLICKIVVCIDWIAPTPVSYTHLDVYKRQDVRR